MSKFKVGEEVIVVCNCNNESSYSIGEVVTIREVGLARGEVYVWCQSKLMGMRETSFKSVVQNRLTTHQASVLSAYTGVLCGNFSDMHKYIEKLFGRPVWTHETGDKGFMSKLKEAAKADFMLLVNKGNN